MLGPDCQQKGPVVPVQLCGSRQRPVRQQTARAVGGGKPVAGRSYSSSGRRKGEGLSTRHFGARASRSITSSYLTRTHRDAASAE